MEAINQDHNFNKGEKGHGSSFVDRYQILFLSENVKKNKLLKAKTFQCGCSPGCFLFSWHICSILSETSDQETIT